MEKFCVYVYVCAFNVSRYEDERDFAGIRVCIGICSTWLITFSYVDLAGCV